MKQVFKYILIGLSLLAVPKVAGAQAVNREGGVATTKTVGALDEDGNYTIKLETWAEGETAVVETATPVDVVLVLDVSGSMAKPKGNVTRSSRTSLSYNDVVNGSVEYFYSFNGGYQRIYAEQDGGRYYLYVVPEEKYYLSTGYYGYTQNRNNASYANSPTNAIRSGITLYEGTSRITALHTAVCAFIDEIEKNDHQDKQGKERQERLHNQVSIVKFGGPGNTYYNENEIVMPLTRTEGNVQSLKDAVNALEAMGYTEAWEGMRLANSVLAQAEEGHSKVVVLFTDGEPDGVDVDDEYAYTQTISVANTTKGALNATVYTVGTFESSPASNSNTYIYLNAVSSNYTQANATWSNRRNPNLSVTGTLAEDGDFYKDASGNVDLTAIFVQISQGIGGSTTTVAESTQIRDVVSSSFTIPQGFDASQVVIYSVRAKKQATLAWDPTTRQDYTPAADQTDAVSAVIDEQDGNKRLVVTGFDFSKADTPTGSNSGNGNWVGERYTQADGRFMAGAKLVIEFKIKEVAGATGGAGTNTNTSDSGVWVKKEDGTYENINHYVIPHTTLPVNIVIKKKGLRSGESATFEVEKCRPKNWDENKTLEQNIAAIEYNEIGKPEPSGNWQNFSKVILTNKGADKAEVTKTLVALDPYWIYRINEDKWSWAYTLSGNTGAEGSIPNTSTVEVNPFSFTNTEKEGVVKHAEAVTINHFGYTIKTGEFAGQQEEHYKSSKVEKL